MTQVRVTLLLRLRIPSDSLFHLFPHSFYYATEEKNLIDYFYVNIEQIEKVNQISERTSEEKPDQIDSR